MRLPRRAAPLFAFFMVMSAPFLLGCGAKPTRSRILVLGFDGADPGVIDLLMSEGKLPHFAKLRQEGSYGRLTSSKPLLSPVIWTTIATGKTPDQHRIGHFVAINSMTGEQLPVTSQMRKVKALWNILSDAGRSVDVVGWWATWPAETVNGSMVSDHLCYHFLFADGATGGKDSTGVTYPPELVSTLAPLVRRPTDLQPQELSRFVHVGADEIARPFDFQDDLSHFKWALATAESYRSIGLRLWEADSPDLLMVYFEGTDTTSHLFGHLFRARNLSGELAQQQRRYGDTVERMYLFADTILGDFLDAMDSRSTIVVLSDHGFRLGELQDDPSKTRDMRRVSEQFHTLQGILYLYGYHVKPHTLLNSPTITDVAPTILALSGAPIAQDMPGRVLSEALEIDAPAIVSTYETADARRASASGRTSDVDPQILAKLQSLGYLQTTSPTGDRNVAAVLFEEGRYAEAVAAYEKIVREKPDDGAARASFAGALGAMGRYDEALEQLAESIRIEPLNPEAYHNRGVIYERQADKEAAIKEYRTALRYNPQYLPSQNALTRLLGPGAAQQPMAENEKKAFLLAEQASQAARRGDYGDAMKLLDEAERVAPRYSLVYQYRSNVAYLMGDRPAAIAALTKAIEIEPDNALFRANLSSLRKTSASNRTASPATR